ncbi:TadE/TadG family type IV pilus assembly protein [Rhizobium sp. AN80A]|uniref:TadE/TadG family type IV pilus assembly protein n=1 Tax=Rhizobium sp. AN80A TaxID=3040673 RepID=UPI0024B34638|nr:TadE/TadG family type IV pilus assembly protein [Rhizobium sp. AN80A]
MFDRLLADRSGNFGLITAILMVPLIGAAGLSIDFSQALTMRTQLQGAADAAAVGAVAQMSPAMKKAQTMTGDGTIAIGKTDAQELFRSQLSGEATSFPIDVSVDVVKTGSVLTSSVTFQTRVPTSFMQILGQTSMPISGTATARYETPSYMDFYMLLDNTPSMGVGATQTDIDKMLKATKNGSDGTCAFACHIVSTSGVEDKNSYYNIARNNKITIRIDVVAQAVKALMAKATDTQTMNNQFRVAAYTFGKTAQDAKLFKVAEINTDLGKVATATNAIQLMSIPYQNYDDDQQTSFDNALAGIKDEIKGTIGKGTSDADRQKIVFFVADGVADSRKPSGCTSPKGANGNRCIEPIDVKSCKALKDKGIKIAVLYTRYLPLPENPFYNDWVKPFEGKISTKMEECASPGLYFAVSPTEGIAEAMQALFMKIVSTPRITS